MTTNDLIPDDYQHRLLQVRGAGDNEFWCVGDCMNELEFLYHERPDFGPEFVLLLRHSVADLSGVTPAVVREYQANALYYPPATRAKYPNLTRWHFRFAKACGKLKDSEKFLKLAEESADDYGGQPMPTRVLAAKIREAYPNLARKTLADEIDAIMERVSKLCGRNDVNGSKPYLEAAVEALRQAREKETHPVTQTDRT